MEQNGERQEKTTRKSKILYTKADPQRSTCEKEKSFQNYHCFLNKLLLHIGLHTADLLFALQSSSFRGLPVMGELCRISITYLSSRR